MPFELVVCDIVGALLMDAILGYIYVGKVTDFLRPVDRHLSSQRQE